MGAVRTFDTGATRDTDAGKHDLEGFLSPLVLRRFAEYMTKHRVQSDGQVRDSDNWQKGIPLDQYMKSAWRHFVAWWETHRGIASEEALEEALCALMFNTMGYLHEHLKGAESESEPEPEPATPQLKPRRFDPTLEGSLEERLKKAAEDEKAGGRGAFAVTPEEYQWLVARGLIQPGTGQTPGPGGFTF